MKKPAIILTIGIISISALSSCSNESWSVKTDSTKTETVNVKNVSATDTGKILIPANVVDEVSSAMDDAIQKERVIAKKDKLSLLAYLEWVDCSKASNPVWISTFLQFDCKISDRVAYQKSIDYISQFLETKNMEGKAYYYSDGYTANLTEKDGDIIGIRIYSLDEYTPLPPSKQNRYYLRNLEERWKFQTRAKKLISGITENASVPVKISAPMEAMANAFIKMFPKISFKRNSSVCPIYEKPADLTLDDTYINPKTNGETLKWSPIFWGFEWDDINGKKYSITYVYDDNKAPKADNDAYKPEYDRLSTGKGLVGVYIINFTDNEVAFVDINKLTSDEK